MLGGLPIQSNGFMVLGDTESIIMHIAKGGLRGNVALLRREPKELRRFHVTGTCLQEAASILELVPRMVRLLSERLLARRYRQGCIQLVKGRAGNAIRAIWVNRERRQYIAL